MVSKIAIVTGWFGFIGNHLTIKLLKDNRAIFKVDYSLRKDTGWSNDIGKLNLDYQVLPDNDYYQNLSYTIKSSQTYDKLSSTVNGLVHPTGLKNFSDTEIITKSKEGVLIFHGFDWIHKTVTILQIVFICWTIIW